MNTIWTPSGPLRRPIRPVPRKPARHDCPLQAVNDPPSSLPLTHWRASLDSSNPKTDAKYLRVQPSLSGLLERTQRLAAPAEETKERPH